jgi:hypothetical protein
MSGLLNPPPYPPSPPAAFPSLSPPPHLLPPPSPVSTPIPTSTSHPLCTHLHTHHTSDPRTHTPIPIPNSTSPPTHTLVGVGREPTHLNWRGHNLSGPLGWAWQNEIFAVPRLRVTLGWSTTHVLERCSGYVIREKDTKIVSAYRNDIVMAFYDRSGVGKLPGLSCWDGLGERNEIGTIKE